MKFVFFILPFAIFFCFLAATAAADIPETNNLVQPKMIKLYGAGGHGLKAYQSGFLVSADGFILTVHSHVLDTDYITAVLSDGRRHEAKLIGADPRLEVAVLKIDAAGLAFFDLSKAVRLDAGARILAFSNIFGAAVGEEPVSVQKGTIAVVTQLEARRGVIETPYHGPVYVLDATTNNSGAAGGALVSHRGELAGMLGKELRNSLNNTWLNYSVPIDELRHSVDDIKAGKFVATRSTDTSKKPQRPIDLASLGITLVPDILDRTPPYVDSVRPGSAAAKAGIRSDDLIVLLGDHLVQTCKTLHADLEYIDFEDTIVLTVCRGQDWLRFSLRAIGESNPTKKDKP